jgi:5-methylcytosine-specific restriction endonuclease McrA
MGYIDVEKKREYQRTWIANRKSEYLKDKSCVECQSHDDLEIDHIDPKQKISHRIWSWTETRRLEELKKCQILCKTCHNNKTQKYREDSMIHGLSMYRSKKCRCGICREAKRQEKLRSKA